MLSKVLRDLLAVPHIHAVSIYGDGMVLQGVGDNQGDQLLRKLVGAEVVGAAGDCHG